MNNVCLIGRLSSDVELKSTSGGTNYARFSIAVQRDFKNKDGEYEADFINCIAWRNTAEFISKYFGKGSMIAIVGSIQTGSYEKDGQKHYTTDINVEEVYFAGSKPEASQNSEEQTEFNIDDSFMPMPGDDDLPF